MPLFRGANLSHGRTEFNYELSKVQHCVWWRFGNIVRMLVCLPRFHVATVHIKCVKYRISYLQAIETSWEKMKIRIP